jgi:hypothetical protein
MGNKTVDWTLFDSIEQVVAELVQRQMYFPVHLPLTEIARESQDIIACLDQLDILLQFMANDAGRINLPDTWNVNHKDQLLELEAAYEALLAVVTKILPERALVLLKDKMH